MAITWLDDYAMMCRKALGNNKTELEALLEKSKNIYNDISINETLPGDQLAKLSSSDLGKLALSDAIINFLDCGQGIAIQLKKGLADIFLQAAPRRVDVIIDYIQNKPVYIDFPKNYLNRDGHPISAVFLMPAELKGKPSVVMCAVSPIKQKYPDLNFFVDIMTPRSVTRKEDEFRYNLQNLINSSLLYYNSLADKIKMPTLPKRIPSRAKITGIQNKLLNKDKSIFTIHSLEPPKDNSSLPRIIIGRTKWKLTYKVQVEGHWRKQACGEGWREHKMIWIDAFEKGKQLLPKPRLNIMPKTLLPTTGHPTGHVSPPTLCEVMC